MELYEEVENGKKSKIPMIIGICIGILFIIIIAIICAIVYLQSTVLTIKLDNKVNSNIEKILYITNENNSEQIYIPIRKIAKFFDYEDYRGDYTVKSEDHSKCYVKNEYETAMFTKDSNVLIKTRGNSDYEYINLKEKVFEKDGELYTTSEGIEQAFNVLIESDSQKNNINIYTMEYLYQSYVLTLKKAAGEDTVEASDNFSDKKAIFQDMIIITKDGQYGIVSATSGESILETKYQEIKYLPTTSDFLVKSNGKYGILGKDLTRKVRIIYDEIKIMDNKNRSIFSKK